MIIGALLEMFSIGMLIPFVSLIVDTDNQFTELFKNFLNFTNPNISEDKFLIISFIFFLILFFFKFTYMVIFIYFKNVFIIELGIIYLQKCILIICINLTVLSK